MTTTLRAELFISVDGWAGSDGLPGYFGYLGPELEAWITAESIQPHLALMGRKTFEVLSGLPNEARDEHWDAMMNRETVVFSRTLATVDWPRARISDDLGEIRRLKATSETPLRTVGSPSLVRQLVSEGLVDTLLLMTFPLFAGPAGREWAFLDIASTELRLTEHRVLDGRITLTAYEPTGHDIPRA